MSAAMLKIALRMFPPGRRLRLRDTPGVRRAFELRGAATVARDGLICLASGDGSANDPIEASVLHVLPDTPPDPVGDMVPFRFLVMIEFRFRDAWECVGFDREDLLPLAIEPEELERDLVGRSVQFPRSSGIGIAFPRGSSDRGVIAAARFEKGQVELRVAVSVEGRETPEVVEADFTQCHLMSRAARVR